jgi:hypothetical protein
MFAPTLSGWSVCWLLKNLLADSIFASRQSFLSNLFGLLDQATTMQLHKQSIVRGTNPITIPAAYWNIVAGQYTNFNFNFNFNHCSNILIVDIGAERFWFVVGFCHICSQLCLVHDRRCLYWSDCGRRSWSGCIRCHFDRTDRDCCEAASA